MLPALFRHTPAVFAVNREYQIFVPVSAPAVMWVRVGRTDYYDDSNGILRSDTDLHRMRVPMEELDAAEKYTVCWRTVTDRKPYYPVLEPVREAEFAFRPVKNAPVRAYMIADAHGMLEPCVEAARRFSEQAGGPDLLILNGDILNHSGDAANFDLYYQLAQELTGGQIPVIVSRGNHDLRGKCAERLTEYLPGDGGNTFYSFRLGPVWGLLLDCAEDKNDACDEYGGTICCHAFRRRQSAYLEQIVARADREYAAPGVEYRIVLSHIPFTERFSAPFNIEEELYAGWVRRLNETVRPHLLLSGHIHAAYLTLPGQEKDAYGMNFPTVVGSRVNKKEGVFAGCGVIFGGGSVRILFTDADRVLADMTL